MKKFNKLGAVMKSGVVSLGIATTMAATPAQAQRVDTTTPSDTPASCTDTAGGQRASGCTTGQPTTGEPRVPGCTDCTLDENGNVVYNNQIITTLNNWLSLDADQRQSLVNSNAATATATSSGGVLENAISAVSRYSNYNLPSSVNLGNTTFGDTAVGETCFSNGVRKSSDKSIAAYILGLKNVDELTANGTSVERATVLYGDYLKQQKKAKNDNPASFETFVAAIDTARSACVVDAIKIIDAEATGAARVSAAGAYSFNKNCKSDGAMLDFITGKETGDVCPAEPAYGASNYQEEPVYTSSYTAAPPADCPAGTTAQSDGTCLQSFAATALPVQASPGILSCGADTHRGQKGLDAWKIPEGQDIDSYSGAFQYKGSTFTCDHN